LRLDAFLGEFVCGILRKNCVPRIAHDRQIVTFASHQGTMDWRRLGEDVNLTLAEIKHLVLQEDDRLIADDRLAKLPIGILWRRWYGDAQARDVHHGMFQPLRMLRPELPRDATGHAHDQRHAELTARHEWDLGRSVDDGVQCEQHEVDGHDLDHWPQPYQSGAYAKPGEAVLGDRRIAYAPFAVFGVEALGNTIAAAVEADVLTECEHRLVGRQLGIQG